MSTAVLVGVDLSPEGVEVLRHAAREARWRGATLEALHAYAPPEPVAAFPVPPGRGKERSDHEGARARAVEQLDRWIDGSGVDLSDVDVVRSVVATKRPGKEVVARAGSFDLVVIGARRRTGISASVLGSVSEHVLRRAVVPVLLVRTAPRSRPGPGGR